MSKNSNLTQSDVNQILKGVALVFITCIIFVIWEQADAVINLVARAFITLGSEVVVTILIVIFIKSITITGTDWAIRVGTGLYSLIGVIGVFCQISYLSDNWHWAAWVIFLVTWLGLGIVAYLRF